MNKIKKIITMSFATSAIALSLVACKPYDTPEFVTISPSQTAFLIPLIGDSTEQSSFESEEMLETAKVATKEIQIPHRWVKTGRTIIFKEVGEYKDNATVIIVERKPVVRTWTASKTSGSTAQNQAIYSESKESIGFSVGMTCSAQIDENNATKFLYRYNNKALENVMDDDIRSMVASEFNSICGNYMIADIISHKEEIMDEVVTKVTDFFAERGITITVLGMNEGITYEDGSIQEAINDKFSSEQLLVTQENNNAVTISKAEADAQALLLAAQAEAEANKILSESITQSLIDMEIAQQWNGEVPQVTGGSTPIIDLE